MCIGGKHPLILERTKNTKRNMLWGVVNKTIKIICPFFIRTIIIKKLGVEYLGLNSMFTSLLSVLSLFELGFDTAVVYIMYGAVAADDKKKLKALFFYFRRIYWAVGLAILCVGLICVPFLPYFIENIDQVPAEINIYWLYLLFLAQTVSSYFFGGYRNSIFHAFQRQDIINNIMSIVTCLFFVIQFILLFLFKNYYYYAFTLPIISIFNNILIFYASRKNYPDIYPEGKLSKGEKKELVKIVKGCFFSKIGGVLSTSFDNLIISTFLGLSILAYYSNYSYIVTAIQGFMVVLYTSIQAGIGNSVILDEKEKNYHNMRIITFVYDWVLGWCTYCLVFLFQPFITLWIGSEGIFPKTTLLLICMNFYISSQDAILGVYKAALGIWWKDRYRCIVGGIFNLCVNVLMVLLLKPYGAYTALSGVVISTILSQIFILTPWATWIVFKEYFRKGLREYITQLMLFFGVMVVTVISSAPLFANIPITTGSSGWRNLAVKLVLCVIIPNILWILLLHRTKLLQEEKKFLIPILKKKMVK